MSAKGSETDIEPRRFNALKCHKPTSSNLVHWLHIAVPPFGTGFVLLVLGYLVLLAGNVFRNGGVGFSNENILDARR